jgi:glycosyltransferase involved in cell wall biosynthesis
LERPSLSVILPAYNEERGIDAILERVLRQREPLRESGVGELEVIVVDDASRDRTAERAAAHSGVRLVRHKLNRGYGAALKTGFSEARGELLAFLDADGTYPPEKLSELCRAVLQDKADMVIGSRMLSRDSEMPTVRRVGNTLFASLLSVVGKHRVWDSASGMRVLRRKVLGSLYPLPDGLDFTPAMSTRALYQDLRMVEVPIPYRERVGRSKLNVVRDGLRFLRSILWTATLYKPLRIFGTLGLAMLVSAVILALPPLVYYVQNHSVREDSIYRLIAVLILSAAGVNVLAFGLISGAIFNLLPGHAEPQPPLPKRFQIGLAWGGFLLLLSGFALMAPAGVEWVRTAQITFHWSYLAAGGTLVLTGLQLSTWFVLLSMVGELSSWPGRARRDLKPE